MTEAPLRAGRNDEVRACVDLWTRACAARDGTAVAGVAERARAKFDRRVAWVVAGAPGELQGFALATAPGSGASIDPPEAAVLGLLAVDPRAQANGLGRRLLYEIDGVLSEAGYRQAVLHVLTENLAAVRLYESAGWRPVGPAFEHSLLRRPFQSYVLDL
ncbi:hypothetical protein GCM10022286_02150 [Gryllotalpicola daejeonensis]|uniref:N-acetyltransferase domain-containing protein n=1 Tax=Gryllotalpicola daejeonensis TaxID=993087 RepID=A0ABP7ZDJ0_9MICO